MTLKRPLVHLLLVALVAATSLTTPAFGQPPDTPTINSSSIPEDREEEGVTTNGQPSPPTQSVSQDPDPVPTPAAESIRDYSDGRMERQAQAWRNHQASGPAYTVAQTRVVKQFIQNGLSPEAVIRRYEDRFIKPIQFRKDGNRVRFLEPAPRNAKDRRLNRKLFLDIACARNFLEAVWTSKEGGYARFRRDTNGVIVNKDEIASWIVAESAADATTALQMTLRNFIEDEFAPLKEQVAKNTTAIDRHEQDILQLKADVKALQEATGTAPGVVPAPTPPPTATTPPVASTPAPSEEASTTPTPTPSETPIAVGDIVVAAPTTTPTPMATETPAIPEDLPSATPSPMATASPTPPEEPPPAEMRHKERTPVDTSLEESQSDTPWLLIGGISLMVLIGGYLGLQRYRKRLAARAAAGIPPAGGP